MQRWILRVFVSVLVLLFIAGAAIQIILWTDVPHTLVAKTLSRRLGLEIAMEGFSTSWTGRTSLEDITVRIPGDPDALLTIDTIQVRHAWLPLILFGRPLNVEIVWIRDVHVRVSEDRHGAWNVDYIRHMLAAMDGGRSQSDLDLPELHVTDIRVTIARSGQSVSQVGPLSLHGRKASPLTWTFEGRIPEYLDITGRIATAGSYAHRIVFDANGLSDMLGWQYRPDGRITILTGQWEGRIAKGNIAGRLQIDMLQTGDGQVAGSVNVTTGPNGLSVAIEKLSLQKTNLPISDWTLADGTILIRDKTLKIPRLAVEAAPLVASISGHWNLQTTRGDFSGLLQSRTDGPRRFFAAWDCSVSGPTTGPTHVQLRAETRVSLPRGRCRAEMEIRGSGSHWWDSHWRVCIPDLVWVDGERKVPIQGVVANVAVNRSKIELVDLSVGNAESINGDGAFSLKDRTGTLLADIQQLQISSLSEEPFDLILDVSADPCSVTFNDLAAIHPEVHIATTGTVDLSSTRLKDARAIAHYHPPQSGATDSNTPVSWRADMSMQGTIAPLELFVESSLRGENVAVGKQRVANLQAELEADIDDKQIRFASSKAVNILDGTFQISGWHKFSSQATHVLIEVADIAIPSIAKVIGLRNADVEGTAGGELHFDAPTLDADRFIASGKWRAEQVRTAAFEAEEAHGEVFLQGGRLSLDSIDLRHRGGSASGKVVLNLNQPNLVRVDVELQDWPLAFAGKPWRNRLSGELEGLIDIVRKQGQGGGPLHLKVSAGKTPLGSVEANMRLDGRVLEIDQMQADVIGGSGTGTAKIYIDNLLKSSIDLVWNSIEPGRLSPVWPWLDDLRGPFSGNVHIGPAQMPRPLEPLLLRIRAESNDLRLHSIALDSWNLMGYLGSRRFLIDKSVLDLSVGQIHLRGSASKHDENMFARIKMGLDSLDIDQIMRSFDPNANPVVGKVSGSVTVVVLDEIERITGSANLQLADSDLIGNTVISGLYNMLRLDVAPGKPTGKGRIRLQMEGPRLVISDFNYQNRGTNIRGYGSAKDLSSGPASPIEGYAVASTQPLQGLPLPGVGELGRMLQALQGDIAAVRIEGTIAEPQVKPVPLESITGDIGRLLWGDSQ